MQSLKKITDTISSVCSEYPSVTAAYLFGSVAKGRSRNPNDIDVAVLLDKRENPICP